jgi:uncharacterized membrane protein YdjX (TVP38/TMEM64 family)
MPPSVPVGKPPVWRRWLPLGLLAAAMAAVFGSGLHRSISFEALFANEDALRSAIDRHWIAALAGFAALYAAVAALSIPISAVLTIGGGYLFGLVPGATATVIGATTGATILFLVARSSFGEALARRLGPLIERFAEGFRKDAASYLLFMRLAPVFPFPVVNIAPAILGAKLQTFFWTTALGIIPGTFAFSSIGAGLGSVVATQIEAFRACRASGAAECRLGIEPGMLLTRQVVIAFILLAVVALLPVALRLWRARSAARNG